jgi:A/G-specific adenine glycosylase
MHKSYTLGMDRSKAITRRVLRWYSHYARSLPWRETSDPYAIWVSEVMLQQTRVDTVIPYYRRFLSRFPTVRDLAAASLQDVLKAWENMGYYGRARNLHRAAGIVAGEMGGTMPRTARELLRLPGIGRYTAAAISSIAFGRRVPALDGNGRRILCRLFRIRTLLSSPKTLKRIQGIAESLVPAKDPGSFNQGVMDIGAALCTPRSPKCGACPLAGLCLSAQQGLQESLPVKPTRPTLPHRDALAALLRDRQGRILIVQRPPRGLLGGLWKLPGGYRGPGETLEEALKRTVREELGIRINAGEELATLNHTFTHFRMTLHAFSCRRLRGIPLALGCEGLRWATPGVLERLPFSRVYRKMLESLPPSY